MSVTVTTASVCPVSPVVAIPTTFMVFPIPYALPPSIISTVLTCPLITPTFAVALIPVTDAPILTNFAL